ncbi:MAG: anti-sigma factor [Pyrinomonadaceae bacterium]
MLCADFENNLSDYLDGALDADNSRACAEHALRCPVCHETLSEVKESIRACRMAEVPEPASPALEARILKQSAPEAWMNCEEFEEHLTDYLDGFLPASTYRRWQRHAAACERCTELPGQVVRAIGACYTYISEEREVPATLHARILQATIETTDAAQRRAPFFARIADRLRALLDPLVSPQFATVAAMLLVAVTVLTSTVSADGSISGMYRASLRLAEQTYAHGASTAFKGAAISGDIKHFADDLSGFMEKEKRNATAATINENRQPPPQKPAAQESK